MKKIEAVNIPGYKPGEIVDFPDETALVYASNGQGKPVGWSIPESAGARPVNRMLDTGETGTSVRRRGKSARSKS